MSASQNNHSSLLSNLALLSVDPSIPHPDPRASERERILWSALAKAHAEIGEMHAKINQLMDMNLRYAEQLQSAYAMEPIRKRTRNSSQDAAASMSSPTATVPASASISSPPQQQQQQHLGSSLYLPQRLRSPLNHQIPAQPHAAAGQFESEGSTGQTLYGAIQTHGFQSMVVGAQNTLGEGTALQQMLQHSPRNTIPGSTAMSVVHTHPASGAAGPERGGVLQSNEMGISGAATLTPATAATSAATVSTFVSQAAMAAAVAAAVSGSTGAISVAANDRPLVSSTQHTTVSLSPFSVRATAVPASAETIASAQPQQQRQQQRQQRQPRTKQRQSRPQSQHQRQAAADSQLQPQQQQQQQPIQQVPVSQSSHSLRTSVAAGASVAATPAPVAEASKPSTAARTVTVDDIVVGDPEEIPSIGKFDSLRTLYIFKERAKEHDRLHGTQWREKMDSKRRQNWSRITAVYNRVVQLRGPGTTEADLDRALQETANDMAANNMTLTRYSQLIRKKINDDRRSLAQQSQDPKESAGPSHVQQQQQQRRHNGHHQHHQHPPPQGQQSLVEQQEFAAHSMQPPQQPSSSQPFSSP
ncbi:hypothetical protein GQ54DRAFT_36758 [Martensiomyces pterosporus]|nr:hypothetical protein GQ54DRAFT_36758 [Martensiomyces pterosporus]